LCASKHRILTDIALSDCKREGKTNKATRPSGLERKLSMNAIVSWRTGERSNSEGISISILAVDDGLDGWQVVMTS
jgi:hypothetical protein